MRWDFWYPTNKLAEQATLLIKYLLWLPFPWKHDGRWVRNRLRLNLNKITKPDLRGLFHTHPAPAIRIVLWGGYIEEEYKGGGETKEYTRRPGHIGFVSTLFCHRIKKLRKGPSYSFWLRGPITSDILYRGLVTSSRQTTGEHLHEFV